MYKFLLSSVFLIGLFIRVFDVNNFPVSLNWDEASHAYNAYSLSQTGKDEWGIAFPTIFRAFGDYKLPVYIYVSVPFVALLGPTPLAIRLVSVLAGALLIPGTYFLVRLLLANFKGSRQTALLASLFVALSPWNIFVSRMAVEANLASTLVVWGVSTFIHGANQVRLRRKPYSLIISSLLLGLSMFTYNSTRLFAPLIFAVLVISYWKYWGLRISLPLFSSLLSRLNKRVITPACSCHFPAFALMLIFIFLTVYQSLYVAGGSARLANISILDQGAINYINEARGNSSLSDFLSRLRYNKVNYVLIVSAKNYFSYFHPSFWFYQGGTHYQFSLPNFSLLPWVLAPLVLVGLASINKISRLGKFILISWLLLAPIPASPTRDNPHVLRILILTPIPQIIAAIGYFTVYQKISSLSLRKVFNFSIIILLLTQTLLFWKSYTGTYSKEYAWAWQSGSRELVSTIKQQYQDYDQIYITKKYGEPHIFFAIYWPWPVSDYQNNKIWEYRDANTSQAWYWVHNLGKISFTNDWEVDSLNCPENQDCLMASASPLFSPKWTEIAKVYDYNQQPVYVLYKSVP